MVTVFSRILAQLRAERGISQRAAASDLNISQALLSHYENGAREPGFAFLVRAADYYGVSVDFLLGRTAMRDGSSISVDDLHDAEQDRDSRLSGLPSAKLGKRLMVNAISVLYDILGRGGDTAVTTASTGYLGAAFYKLFYLLYSRSGKNMEAYFPESDAAFTQIATARLLLAEAKAKTLICDKKRFAARPLPEISGESLAREYPQLAQSLFTVLHQASK
ncbi:MAG: helix-turn-helix domain-containing protein [Oscillospiraceae bacterium]|jgi:transcriptional regulator with XRE-family HTH domain|nr:helix-turn-helix domain-containing protein [Oscillospiraceae bacterium]